MKRVTGTTTALLVSAALISTLSGCSFTITPTSTSPLTPAESTSVVDEPGATPEADPEPAALIIPGCESLITLAQAQAALDRTTAVFFDEYPADEYSLWYDLPAVASEISGLTVGRWCWWGIENSDYGFYLLVAEVDRDSRNAVEEALDADGFSTSIMGARTVHQKGIAGDYVSETHEFSGDIWIISDSSHPDITNTIADLAYEAMQTANPTLGL